MSVKNRVFAVTLASLSSGSVTSSFAPVNTSGLSNACFLVRINNASNQDVTISYDGSTSQDYVLANSVLELQFQTNSQPSNYVALMAAGTKIYVKGTAGTGTIYVSGYYQV